MSEPVNFKHKISRQRPYGKAEPGLRASEGNLGAVIDQLESDRGRIINSACSRRRRSSRWSAMPQCAAA
jgi:dGTPase